MFQPLPKYPVPLIDYFRKIKFRYMVTQAYPRGQDIFTEGKIQSLIVTHYMDKGRAIDHVKTLRKDTLSRIYDLEDDVERGNFNKLLDNKDEFLVYTAVTDKKRANNNLNRLYKNNIRRFIEKKTNWKIGGKHEINPGLEIILGELFVILKYSNYDTIEVKMEEIENS